MFKKNQITLFILIIIVIFGFFFRLKGISDNHSFWSDEAFVATLARDIIEGKRSLLEGIRQYAYQPLFLIIITISFTLFGSSEFTARLPIVIFDTLGIIAIFLFTCRLSNRNGGLLAAFLYSFSQINLANATQAKTYSIIQVVILFSLYLMTFINEKNKKPYLLHGVIITLATVSTFLHYIGALIWIPYIFLLGINYNVTLFLRKYKFYLIPILLLLGLFFLLSGSSILQVLISSGNKNPLFPYNHLTYVRELFWKNYSFITLPAVVGMIVLWNSKRKFAIALLIMLLVYLYFWSFKYSTHNVRYVLPLFGILFTLFAVFWSFVAEKLLKNHSSIIALIVGILIFGGGYKIVRKPFSYYTPNADIYADVQIADYKTAFNLIKDKYADLSNIAVFTNWSDTQRWYLPNKAVTAYFMIGRFGNNPEPNIVDNVMIYGTLKQFLTEMSKHQKGLVIVEDWQSLLPEEIKIYVKKNLKREFRVEGLPQAQGDNWPLGIYSWGDIN